MQVLHPDVFRGGSAADAGRLTQRVIAAYRLLAGERRQAESEEGVGPFDAPDSDPALLFVDPFSCSINPCDYELLQAIAAGATVGRDGLATRDDADAPRRGKSLPVPAASAAHSATSAAPARTVCLVVRHIITIPGPPAALQRGCRRTSECGTRA